MRLALISSARAGSARSARSARRRCAWGRASSPTARPSSRPGRPSARARRGRGAFSSSSRPSALASRLAGSIVTTATLAPRAAIPSAIAAEVVVLPTPPEPPHTQIALALQQVGDAHRAQSRSGRALRRAAERRRSQRVGQPFELGRPERLGEQVGQLDQRSRPARRAAVELLAAGPRPGPARTGRRARAAAAERRARAALAGAAAGAALARRRTAAGSAR